MFSATLMPGTQALRSGSSGRQRTLLGADLGPACPVVAAVDVDLAGVRRALAGQHLDQLFLAVAGDAGDADDLAAATRRG